MNDNHTFGGWESKESPQSLVSQLNFVMKRFCNHLLSHLQLATSLLSLFSLLFLLSLSLPPFHQMMTFGCYWDGIVNLLFLSWKQYINWNFLLHSDYECLHLVLTANSYCSCIVNANRIGE